MKLFEKLASKLQKRRLEKQRQQLTDSCYAYLFDVIPDEFVCFDCETTGLNTKKDTIITLSAVKIIHQEIYSSQSLNLVIRQDQKINAQSISIHQIRNLDVSNSDYLYLDEFSAIQAFLEFIEGRTLVGYFLEFDVAMVNRVIRPVLGIDLPNPRIEVSAMFYEYKRQKYQRSCIEPNIDLSFEYILKQLDIPNMGQHDAYNDALMTALMFIKLKDKLRNA